MFFFDGGKTLAFFFDIWLDHTKILLSIILLYSIDNACLDPSRHSGPVIVGKRNNSCLFFLALANVFLIAFLIYPINVLCRI